MRRDIATRAKRNYERDKTRSESRTSVRSLGGGGSSKVGRNRVADGGKKNKEWSSVGEVNGRELTSGWWWKIRNSQNLPSDT